MATSGYLISRAALVTQIGSIAIAITCVRLFAIGRAGSRYLERLTSHLATFEILVQLRAWFFAAVEPLAPARLTSHRTGDLVSRSVADIETLESFYVRGVIPPIAAVAIAVVACGMLAWFDPWLGACLAFFLAVAGVVLPVAMHRLASSAARDVVSSRAEFHATMIDEIQGRADLLIFGSANMHKRKLAEANTRLRAAQRRLGLIRGLSIALGSLAISGTVVVLLLVAVPLVSAAQLDGVYLALLIMAAIASFEAVQPLSPALQQLEATRTAGRRVFDLIDSPPAVQDPTEPLERPKDFSIEFRGLSFGYEGDDCLALNDVSFEVSEGETLGIVGPSGAGKSTIANLLVRFWDYERGSIKIGRRELRECSGTDIRSIIALVPQDIHLFNTTLRDNLLVANPDATDADLTRALQLTMLGGFVARLPEGLNTLVGENGLLLSGGERQRVGIARALLKEASIVILDEPTANLDPDTERMLMLSLRTALHGRTVIIISHRSAALVSVDSSILLTRGRATDVTMLAS